MMTASEYTQTCILVLGMHRSGTSATAGALELCGVALGSELLAPGDDNPKGYFEHERAVGIDERLLAALGSGWADVRPLPTGWQDGPAAREAIEEVDALLASDFVDTPLFALKDPRMCRLLPAWLPALSGRGVRVVALFVARDPVEVAASIEARNGWASPLGKLLWLRHTCDAEAATRGIARTAIAYDALLADPARSLSAALARVGVALPSMPEHALRAFADADARHQRGTGMRDGDHLFAAPVAQAADALAAIAGGADAWGRIEAAGAALDEAWHRSGGTLDALAGMAMDIERKARAVRDAASIETSRLQSELNAQLAWSEVAVREREALQAEAAGLRSDLTAQLAWSEVAVREREGLQAEAADLRSDLTAQMRWSEQAVADWSQREAGYARALAARDAELAARDAELAAIHRSIAWRLSRPLRAIETTAKRIIKRISGKQ